MSFLRVVLRNIAGSPGRSRIVFLAALLLAGLAVAGLLIVQGGERSLRLAADRLGADILVVPTEARDQVEAALVMGAPVQAWMLADNVQRIAAIPGVAAVSPQLFLHSLARASCCSVSEMLVVAYDPATDLTLRPWLERNAPEGLAVGEGLGGSYVYLPAGQEAIVLYGSPVRLVGNLEPTGTNLDRTLFVTFETARRIAARSYALAERPLEVPPFAVSAILVKVRPGDDAHVVALEILRRVPEATPVESSDLFRTFRGQLEGLRLVLAAALGLSGLALLALLSLVFALAAGERRREVGVLRALGASRWASCCTLLAEAEILALGGGAAGLALAAVVAYLFHDLIAASLGLPLLWPSPGSLAAAGGGGLALALGAVALAALWPALQAAREEPALAMRE